MKKIFVMFVFSLIVVAAFADGDFKISWNSSEVVLKEYLGDDCEVEIPDGVTHIGFMAFYNNKNIEKVIFPDGVVSIGSLAFSNCSNLREVYLPKSLLSIEGGAFHKCENLSCINIPKGVSKIGYTAFSGVDAVAIDFDDDNSYYIMEDGVLFSKDMTFLHSVLDRSVSSFDVPSTVSALGEWSFAGCENLESISLPEGLTQIGQAAFDGCKRLGELLVPASVTFIGESAFSGVPSRAIKIDSKNEKYIIVDEILFSKDMSILCSVLNKDILSFSMPDSVVQVGNAAFSNCKSLEEISFSENVTHIGDTAFYNCVGLKSITLPNKVTRIGNDSFRGCKSLVSFKIPKSVKSIGDRAFLNCDGLTEFLVYRSSYGYKWAKTNKLNFKIVK
ncbi:MAG: leucine-rich repeat domain-containing protein [Spirochaetales bacterium]|nr:leucine-rich repeat domain-containing protein [Spirochaetales bacterium]